MGVFNFWFFNTFPDVLKLFQAQLRALCIFLNILEKKNSRYDLPGKSRFFCSTSEKKGGAVFCRLPTSSDNISVWVPDIGVFLFDPTSPYKANMSVRVLITQVEHGDVGSIQTSRVMTTKKNVSGHAQYDGGVWFRIPRNDSSTYAEKPCWALNPTYFSKVGPHWAPLR